MRDPFFAPILFKIETVLHETDRLAKEQGLPFTDSAARSLLVRAANEARGKPAKAAATSPKDRLLADAVARLGRLRGELLVVEDESAQESDARPLPVADWLLALDAARQSCEIRSSGEPGSRGYLDFLADFLAKPDTLTNATGTEQADSTATTVHRSFGKRLAQHRPPGALTDDTARLADIAARWAETLVDLLDGTGSDLFALDDDQADDLALAMTELAEDLHTDAGLWRALESANRARFDTPLPLLVPADGRVAKVALERFDARRFQFFLDGVWRHFQPDSIVSPTHEGFRRIAAAAAAFFARAFAAEPRSSAVVAFLDGGHARGWDVKAKLVWLGTHSFLLRFAYEDYLEKHRDQGKKRAEDEIALTDDFLCQQCTAWSGLGALELLAECLPLTPEERADLLGWHARHAAFYRVESVTGQGAYIETLEVINLLNDRPYTVRVELPRDRVPFQIGKMVYGSLVPWRGEWYWSGAQQTWPRVPADFSRTRRDLIERSSRIVYRYRPDLAAKAAAFAAEQHAAFVRYHGSDLAVFPDGLTMAAAERKRMREANEARAAVDEAAREALARRGKDGAEPDLPLPREVLECRDGVAIFSDPVEGCDIMMHFDTVRAGLRNASGMPDGRQAQALQEFVESPALSPGFVRRAVGLHGWSGLAALYRLPPDDPMALDFLLRRHKGAYYRPRLPNLALHGVEG